MGLRRQLRAHGAQTRHRGCKEGVTMTGRLDGKVALISGTGGGIGQAASRLFAAQGAPVVATALDAEAARRTQKLVQDSGYAMVSVAPLDVSTPEAARAWMDEAVAAWGVLG